MAVIREKIVVYSGRNGAFRFVVIPEEPGDSKKSQSNGWSDVVLVHSWAVWAVGLEVLV